MEGLITFNNVKSVESALHTDGNVELAFYDAYSGVKLLLTPELFEELCNQIDEINR